MLFYFRVPTVVFVLQCRHAANNLCLFINTLLYVHYMWMFATNPLFHSFIIHCHVSSGKVVITYTRTLSFKRNTSYCLNIQCNMLNTVQVSKRVWHQFSNKYVVCDRCMWIRGYLITMFWITVGYNRFDMIIHIHFSCGVVRRARLTFQKNTACNVQYI